MDPITLGVIGAGLILLLRRKKKKPFTPGTGDLPTDIPDVPSPEPDPDPDPGPGPQGPTEPGHVPSNVVGGGWEWPEKNYWGSEGSIAGSLITLSQGRYAPGGTWAQPNYTITSVSGQGAVRQFQRDWNELVDHWALFTKANTSKPVGKLTADGWIGPNTWKAMRWAFRHSKHIKNVGPADPYMNWNNAIDGARSLPS